MDIHTLKHRKEEKTIKHPTTAYNRVYHLDLMSKSRGERRDWGNGDQKGQGPYLTIKNGQSNIIDAVLNWLLKAKSVIESTYTILFPALYFFLFQMFIFYIHV